MGIRQVVFSSTPFVNSFVEQVTGLGVRIAPVIVIDAETCHPVAVREQLKSLVHFIEEELTGQHVGTTQDERIHRGPSGTTDVRVGAREGG